MLARRVLYTRDIYPRHYHRPGRFLPWACGAAERKEGINLRYHCTVNNFDWLCISHGGYSFNSQIYFCCLSQETKWVNVVYVLYNLEKIQCKIVNSTYPSDLHIQCFVLLTYSVSLPTPETRHRLHDAGPKCLTFFLREMLIGIHIRLLCAPTFLWLSVTLGLRPKMTELW